ncbi:MAG: hypothetical protein ABW092_20380 [Candidatus Thiodiazotropha sp.]
MYTLDQLVYYSPPKSVGYGHQARRKDPRKAWSETTAFMDSFALGTSFGQNPIRLSAGGQPNRVMPDVKIAAVERCIEKLGPGETSVTESKTKWIVPPENILTAVDLALSCDTWDKQKESPIQLHFAYYFRMRELDISPQPTQSNRLPVSILGIDIGRPNLRMFQRPHIYIPYAWDSAEFKQYRSAMEAISPFRFREQYYRRAILTKNRNNYRMLKP